MKKALCSLALVLSFLLNPYCFAAIHRFEKISDHCYFFESKGETPNVAAIVSDDGVLLVDPPGDPDPASALDALKKLTSRPVRWVVSTDYRFACSGGAARFLDQGAVVLWSGQLVSLVSAEAADGSEPENKSGKACLSTPRLVFDRQMRVFPGGVEVRIIAVQHRAHTGGDVMAFVPAEKVLIVGELYAAGKYPEIDINPGDGSALGWLDAMKQAIDAVPLLKSAIPQKTEIKPGEEEKSLEEMVTVISARGPKSNLQEMKDLLEAARKLRGEIAKVVSSGRDMDSFLSSSAAAPFRIYENFDTFARQLFDALSNK